MALLRVHDQQPRLLRRGWHAGLLELAYACRPADGGLAAAAAVGDKGDLRLVLDALLQARRNDLALRGLDGGLRPEVPVVVTHAAQHAVRRLGFLRQNPLDLHPSLAERLQGRHLRGGRADGQHELHAAAAPVRGVHGRVAVNGVLPEALRVSTADRRDVLNAVLGIVDGGFQAGRGEGCLARLHQPARGGLDEPFLAPPQVGELHLRGLHWRARLRYAPRHLEPALVQRH
mmetsp:Transcript_20157/g.53511  ORF Transcript_20157/g.53511 Transcript_20157/m.53511 type:complete len:231 (+) Transcript_20157:475-1167(+)